MIKLSGGLHQWLAGACIGLLLSGSHAEVIPIDRAENGVAAGTDVTQTYLWRGDKAKATLIMIPGGDGHIGLAPGRTDLGGFYGKTLKPLSNPDMTSGFFNVVVFDSPISLPVGSAYPTSRAATDHLERIESVVRFYQQKFGKPIWLMGHSNGAVSVTEFYKYLQKLHKESSVSGIIYSSGRNGASFSSDTNVPVLFLAHEKDGCSKSTNSNSLGVFKDLKKGNQSKMDYVVLTSGDAELQDPCRSGFHMFFNANEEAYKAIDRFASGTDK